MNFYVVYDKKAKIPTAIFMSMTDEQAIRSYESLLTNPMPTIFSTQFEDFDLVKVGSSDCIADNSNIVREGASYSAPLIKQLRLNRAEREVLSDKKCEELKSEILEEK